MRYSFFEHREAIRKNPAYKLPADINAPIIEYFRKLGANSAALQIERLQANVNYATVKIKKAGDASKEYTVQVDAGMCDSIKYDVVYAGSDGYITTITKSIKNKNLSKTKPKELENV